MQDGRVEIVERVDVMDGFAPEIVRDAVAYARFNACAGHPTGEPVGVVVAPFCASLEHRHAPEFGAPHDEGLFE